MQNRTEPITIRGALAAAAALSFTSIIDELRLSKFFAQPEGWNEIAHWTSLPVRMLMYPVLLGIAPLLGLGLTLLSWVLVLLLSPVILYVGHRQRKALGASGD
ncbi:MAG: hypothetical protein ACYDHH_07995 [Solirubrobacteraceae bacterium]